MSSGMMTPISPGHGMRGGGGGGGSYVGSSHSSGNAARSNGGYYGGSGGSTNGHQRAPSSSFTMSSGGFYGVTPNTKTTPNSNRRSSGGSGSAAPVPVAVESHHQVKYVNVPSTFDGQPTTIEVSSRSIPINILLRSSSSWLNVQQMHQGSMGSYQESKSEDQPHTLKHVVTKPVIQELHELITPYRFITQEVKPVSQIIETIVARGQQLKDHHQPQTQQQTSGSPLEQQYEHQSSFAGMPFMVSITPHNLTSSTEAYYQPSNKSITTITMMLPTGQSKSSPSVAMPPPPPPPKALKLQQEQQESPIEQRHIDQDDDPYQIDHESFYGIEQQHIDLEPMTAYSEHKEQWMNELIGVQQNRYQQAIAKALLSTVYGIPALASPKSFRRRRR